MILLIIYDNYILKLCTYLIESTKQITTAFVKTLSWNALHTLSNRLLLACFYPNFVLALCCVFNSSSYDNHILMLCTYIKSWLHVCKRPDIIIHYIPSLINHSLFGVILIVSWLCVVYNSSWQYHTWSINGFYLQLVDTKFGETWHLFVGLGPILMTVLLHSWKQLFWVV